MQINSSRPVERAISAPSSKNRSALILAPPRFSSSLITHAHRDTHTFTQAEQKPGSFLCHRDTSPRKVNRTRVVGQYLFPRSAVVRKNACQPRVPLLLSLLWAQTGLHTGVLRKPRVFQKVSLHVFTQQHAQRF